VTPLSFVKMEGTGNDFILLDLRRGRFTGSLPRLARQLCRRSRVGADGVLTVEPSRRADVRMRVINPDGSEAEMCGNGARCVALYAAHGLGRRHVTIETKAGVVHAHARSTRRVHVTLPAPSVVRLQRLTALGRPLMVHRINVGVPHAVVFVPVVRRVDVQASGRVIRRHRTFRPAGTNVDFVEVLNAHAVRLRTYERGVEAETQACGTGAVAAALVAAHLGRCRSPVTVYPASGERLVVRFHAAGHAWPHHLAARRRRAPEDGPGGRSQVVGWRDVSLEGEVRRVFEGVLS